MFDPIRITLAICKWCEMRFYVSGIESGWAKSFEIVCHCVGASVRFTPAPPEGFEPSTDALTVRCSAN